MNKSELDLLINGLKEGETLLTSLKKVNGDKIQVEIAEKVRSPYNRSAGRSAVTQMFNASDHRFNGGSGARRAWQPGTAGDLKKLFPSLSTQIDECSSKEVGHVVYVGIKNPTINGQRLRLQVEETTTPNEREAQIMDKVVKTAGADGNVVTSGGMPVISRTHITMGEATHTFLPSDEVSSSVTVAESSYAAAANEVAG